MRVSKKQLQEIIKQAMQQESYVPREVLEWTQETEKKTQELRELLEHMLDNAEDFPNMKREPAVRQALSVIRKNVEEFSNLENALEILYSGFYKESKR